jgi:hypothetical protein
MMPWSGHRAAIEVGAPVSFAEDGNYNESASELREAVERMWQRL